jgi:hypothetical protein
MPTYPITVLNLAGGKLKPLFDINGKPDKAFLVNLDSSYYSNTLSHEIERNWLYWRDTIDSSKRNVEYYCQADIYDFLSRTIIKFDVVTIYRFLEHVPFDKVLFFIYLLSTVTDPGSGLDIIVPNYRKLAEMILNENVDSKVFEAHNIVLTTELLNEPSCPHASIWTVDRLDKFFRLEKRFKTVNIEPFKFDGRDIYLRAIFERV